MAQAMDVVKSPPADEAEEELHHVEFSPSSGGKAVAATSQRDDVEIAKARGMARLIQRLNSLGYEVDESHWEVKVKYYRGRPSPGRYAWHGCQFENMERACQAFQLIAYAQQDEPPGGWPQPTEGEVGWLHVAVQKGDSLLQRALWSNAHTVLSDHTSQCKFVLCADDQYQPINADSWVAGNALLQAAGTKKFSAGGWKDCVQLMQQLTWQGMTFPIGSRVSFVLSAVCAADKQHALGMLLPSTHLHMQTVGLPAADGLADAAADADVDIAAEPMGDGDDDGGGSDPVGLAAELAAINDRLMQQQQQQQQQQGAGGSARSGKRSRKSRQAVPLSPTDPAASKEHHNGSVGGKRGKTQAVAVVHASTAQEDPHHSSSGGAVVAAGAMVVAGDDDGLQDDAQVHSAHMLLDGMDVAHTQVLQEGDEAAGMQAEGDADGETGVQVPDKGNLPETSNAATLLCQLLYLQQHEAAAAQAAAAQNGDVIAPAQELQPQPMDDAYQPVMPNGVGVRQRAARTGAQQQRRAASQARERQQRAAQEVASSADTRTASAATLPLPQLGGGVPQPGQAAGHQLVLKEQGLPRLPAPVFEGSGVLAPLQEVAGLQAVGQLLRHMGHGGAVKQLWQRYNTHYRVSEENRRLFALDYLQLCEAAGDQDEDWVCQVLQQQFELQL